MSPFPTTHWLEAAIHNRTLVHQAEKLLNFEHGDSPSPSRSEGSRSQFKRTTLKQAASLDSDPTSRLKRQLSECSKVRRPLDATPLGLTENYEEAKLNLQSLASGHSSNNFHPRAFTSKRATASLPYVTHLVPRSILTESLPQKPAENYLFKALPRPPTEGQLAQSEWTTDLGRSSSAPTRVRFADPMVQYNPTPAARESCEFSQFELSKNPHTGRKTDLMAFPKSCIKSTGQYHQVQGKQSLSAKRTDSSPPARLCDSPVEEEFRASISFMSELIFPEDPDQGAGSEPSVAAGAGGAKGLSSKAIPLSISSNVEKDVRSRSTDHELELRKLKQFKESIRNMPSGPARSALPIPAGVFQSSSAPSTPSNQGSYQRKQDKPLHVPRQLEKESSQYANDYRDKNTPKFSMSPKIKRIEVSNLQGTATQLQQGRKILPTSGKVTITGRSCPLEGSKGFAPTYPSQPPGHRKLDAIPDLPSPIVDDLTQCRRTIVTPQVQTEETRNLGKRSFRERTDRSPTVSPQQVSPLTLPPRGSRKQSTICPDSPSWKESRSPCKRLKDLQSVGRADPRDINTIVTGDSEGPRSDLEPGEISPRLDSEYMLNTEASLEDINADARFSNPPSVSSEAPSTSSRTDFSPVPSPPAPTAPITTTLESWRHDLTPANLEACHRYGQSEATNPRTIDVRDGTSQCQTPFQCVVLSETEELIPRALEPSIYDEAKSPLDLESKESFDRPNCQKEPEPVPRELLGMFGEDMIGDQIVEKAQETTMKQTEDTIETGSDRSEAAVTTSTRPQCFCTCSKRWENWNLYLRDKEDEPMKCSSQSSIAGRSSISSHTDDSFLWDSAPQIAIIKPEECLFSELKSPPIYLEGLRFSTSKTSVDCEPGADNQFIVETTNVENEEIIRLDADGLPKPIQTTRCVNSPPEDRKQMSHPSIQGLRNDRLQNQTTDSNFTAIIMKPPPMKKRSLSCKGSETNDRPETPRRFRRRRDHCTSITNGKECGDLALLSTLEVSSSSMLKESINNSKCQSIPFDLAGGKSTIITKFEFSILSFPQTILHRILVELDYLDFFRLSQVSRVLRTGFGVGEAQEVILKVFLGDLGYSDSLPSSSRSRTITHRFLSPNPTVELDGGDVVLENKTTPLLLDDSSFNSTGGAIPDPFSSAMTLGKRNMRTSSPLEINLQELHAFHYLRQAGEKSFLELANRPTSHRPSALSAIQAYCRLHNKLVIRARLRFEDPSNPIHLQSHQFRSRKPHPEIFSPGTVVVFRLWIPSEKKPMSKAELLKCEIEMLRSGIQAFARRGDIFWNAALGSSDNTGRLIYDGQHLQELQVLWDSVGQLPDWLNMFLFPPSFYHHTIKSSNLNPIFYLDLTDFKEQLINSLSLVDHHEPHETAEDQSQQGMLNYLGLVEIRAGTKTGVLEGIECFSNTHHEYILPECIHPDWVGKLMVEIQVSSLEKLDQLLSKFNKAKAEDFFSLGFDHASSPEETRHRTVSRLKSAQLSPWRIIRQKSSPGMVWIRLPIRA
ncbi:hypothetical protein PGTUg99_001412 [Puccinia graminis f. sp. tritici]|uniref:F-box domain-containing protein n=1 Tax=Puccinia graminis f. sp. tritici TaxID=56615 RepID=A0A5B0RYP3_PUCGR|nr:hypothetical protein PGTUg99_001412 [Puccinia graminis f. sp. tritici]